MKKSLMFASAVVAMAFAVSFTSCGTKGCMEAKDDKYNADATVDDPSACSAAETDAKFVGNWTFTITDGGGTYAVNITDATADYAVTANSDLGLNGVTPVNVALNVSGKEATAAPFSIGNANISNLKFTYVSVSAATLSATVSGTGTAADGTFIDNGTK